MERRRFLKDTVIGSAGLLIGPLLPGIPSVVGPDGQVLPEGYPDATKFLRPPASARPYTYWMWMNGNITKDGITLDLEVMQRGGIGGAYMYNNAVGILRGLVDYGSEGWMEIVPHAVQEEGLLCGCTK